MMLPPLAAFNAIATEFLDRAEWYKPVQQYIVPIEARMVAAALVPIGIQTKVTPQSSGAAMYMVKQGAAIPVDLAWNCLGWQSGLLFLVSLIVGLHGNYSNSSRLKCIFFGLTGTLLVNIFRMTFVAAGIYYINALFGMIIHDYFAALITLIWLLIFWWFSYTFILEGKNQQLYQNSN
jgi:exosortase/archaeosortase family protein